MKFNVSGVFVLGRETRKFEKVVEAESEGEAKHLTFALLGSNNGVRRNQIQIAKVTSLG